MEPKEDAMQAKSNPVAKRAAAINEPIASASNGSSKRFCLINASTDSSAETVQAVLDDFEDALLAYDRASSGTLRGREKMEPAFTRLQAASASPAELLAIECCDAVIVGFAVADPTIPDLVLDAQIARKAKRLYAIAICPGRETAPGELALTCPEHALGTSPEVWHGGLVIAGGADILPAQRSPRMGARRRARSEAIDRLIAAVRAGLSVRDAAWAFGATKAQAEAAERNIIIARRPHLCPPRRIP